MTACDCGSSTTSSTRPLLAGAVVACSVLRASGRPSTGAVETGGGTSTSSSPLLLTPARHQRRSALGWPQGVIRHVPGSRCSVLAVAITILNAILCQSHRVMTASTMTAVASEAAAAQAHIKRPVTVKIGQLMYRMPLHIAPYGMSGLCCWTTPTLLHPHCHTRHRRRNSCYSEAVVPEFPPAYVDGLNHNDMCNN